MVILEVIAANSREFDVPVLRGGVSVCRNEYLREDLMEDLIGGVLGVLDSST